jgi:hypothetical protein
MNSYLQALFMTKEFRRRIFKIELKDIIQVAPKKVSENEDPSAATADKGSMEVEKTTA